MNKGGSMATDTQRIDWLENEWKSKAALVCDPYGHWMVSYPKLPYKLGEAWKSSVRDAIDAAMALKSGEF
jgi:hypothetical protein